jgi:hypothetical protein
MMAPLIGERAIMLSRLEALWIAEPVRVQATVVAVVLFVAAKAGVFVDPQSLGVAVALILPVVLGGEVVRQQVSPLAREPEFTTFDLEGRVSEPIQTHGDVEPYLLYGNPSNDQVTENNHV